MKRRGVGMRMRMRQTLSLYRRYWMPKYKAEYCAWLASYYGKPAGHFRKMKLARLKAIYISTRERAVKSDEDHTGV